jgi:putative oligomerization/nucleic acid binding protein
MIFHSAFALLFLMGPLVLVGLVALVVWAATRPAAQPASVPPYGPPAAMPPRPATETPLDILARRFASGEISADEYQKARDLLRGDTKS